jgi:hypothetical protein
MLPVAVLTLAVAFVGVGANVDGAASTAFIGAGILVSLLTIPAWRKEKGEEPRPASKRRIGYLGREGSKGNLRNAKFGKDLDTAIDNAGDVDASEADFGSR